MWAGPMPSDSVPEAVRCLRPRYTGISHERFGGLVLAHANRRQQYESQTLKLKRISLALNNAGGTLSTLQGDRYEEQVADAKNKLRPIGQEVNLADLLKLLDEHASLVAQLKGDLEQLAQYGIDR